LDPVVINNFSLDKPFIELIQHARDFVTHSHSHEVCQVYAAQQVADGHGLDLVHIQADRDLFEQHGVVQACAIVQHQHAANYLQPDIVRDEYKDFDQYDLLLSLAQNGAEVLRPPNWTPNMGVGINPRNVCKQMADAVHVRMAQEHAIGDIMLVECDVFKALCLVQQIQFHVTELGWVFKPGEKLSDLLGRIVDDYSNSTGPLNTPETREAMEYLYNMLQLPQLADMCESLITARSLFPGELIHTLKEDISRAYRRIKFKPTEYVLMVVLLPPTADHKSYYAVRLSQPFGHNASGHAWGVVARAIEWHMTRALLAHRPPTMIHITQSVQGMYVDDLFSFGTTTYLEQASLAFANAARVAGHGAHDILKHGVGPDTQSLGWTFMDRHDAVMPNSKGWYNLLNLFFCEVPWNIKPKDKLIAKTLMRLGSYASRYSRALISLRAFTQSFYGDVSDATPFAMRTVSARTVQDIWMWRVVLRLISKNPVLMATPPTWPVIDRFTPDQQARRANIVVYVDACTKYHACGIFVQDILCCQFVCPARTHYYRCAREDIHINFLEMLSVVAGALVTLNECPTIKHLHIWCDNTTSVSWSHTNRVDSPFACFATQMLTLLAASRRVLITVGWVEGVRNSNADAISRYFDVPQGSHYFNLLQSPTYRQLSLPPPFLQSIVNVCSMSHSATFRSAQLARIALDGVNGLGSVLSI
jgi:hypothetical protein